MNLCLVAKPHLQQPNSTRILQDSSTPYLQTPGSASSLNAKRLYISHNPLYIRIINKKSHKKTITERSLVHKKTSNAGHVSSRQIFKLL